MNLQGFELISSNCDIMILIYKMLDFADQLGLASVSGTLKSIFKTFIWTENYETLTISQCTMRPRIALTNAARKSRLLLRPRELQDFLRMYAHKVRQLTILGHCPNNMGFFKNVISLEYNNMTLPKEHLQLVAKSCVLLESLRLIFCKFDEDFIDTVKAVKEMKNLKRFIVDYNGTLVIRYRELEDILFHLKQLESLRLTAVMVADEMSLNRPLNPINLKELDLEIKSISSVWPINIFSCVTILQIKLSSITEMTLREIAKACVNLQQLKFRQATFKNINFFSLPAQVSAVSIDFCAGLTFNNLRQLLSRQGQIISFCFSNSRFRGTFEDFPISPAIQSLCFEGVATSKFRGAYEGNVHLKELTWHIDDEDADDGAGHEVPLATCVNLAKLDIRQGFIPTSILLQLKFLRKLTVSNQTPFIQWSDILTLLQHPSLNEFTIGLNYVDNGYLESAADIPSKGFPINLNSLKVPLGLFRNAATFFLDLFCQNLHLKITSCYEQPIWPSTVDDIFGQLIAHTHFPRDLKTLGTCCYVIDCADLRSNFTATMETFEHNEEHFLNKESNDICFVLDRQIN